MLKTFENCKRCKYHYTRIKQCTTSLRCEGCVNHTGRTCRCNTIKWDVGDCPYFEEEQNNA